MTTPDRNPRANGAAHATEEATLPLEHGALHVRQDGPPDAPVLLLLHGSATSGRSWDALVPRLAASHRVVRIDLPGHGRSAEPVGRGYEIPEQASTLGAALDALSIRRATVVGHSSGGYAATALAEQRPDVVAALGLINTGPSMDAFLAPDTAALDPARWPPTDEQVRRFASSGFRPGFRVPPELVADLRGMTFHAVREAMRAASDYLLQRTLPDRLAALGKPLWVLFGERDGRWRASSAADYRVVPGARVELLPEAGHTPILEEPARTAALLLAFTRDHAAGAPDGR